MARTTLRPTPTATRPLQPLGCHCPLCGETMWAAYHITTDTTRLQRITQAAGSVRPTPSSRRIVLGQPPKESHQQRRSNPPVPTTHNVKIGPAA